MDLHGKGIKSIASNAGLSGLTALTGIGLEVVSHNPILLAGGGFVAYVCWKYSVGEKLLDLRQKYLVEQKPDGEQAIEQIDQQVARGEEVPQTPAKSVAVATIQQKQQDGPRRLTIDEIVEMCEPNSFKVVIGSSLTQVGNPPLQVKFYKQHFKFIGASQKGKSSMAAAFLDIVTRTHDTSRVLIALLDFEDMTSKLFADLPHLAEVQVEGKNIPLHATTREQVLEYLGYIVEIVHQRYEMSKLVIMNEPILLVYLEEFLALKDYFKTRVNAAPKEEKDQAVSDYADFVYRIKEIARLGLKARVQLLMCAQVDYRDDDLQEALINVSNGFSFSVRVSAAQAAGFYDTELLSRNARENAVGQAVAETASCKDLLLAPEYDLEAKLLAFEEAELEAERRKGGHITRVKSNFLTPAGGHGPQKTVQRQVEPSLTAIPVKQVGLPLETILNLYDAGKISANQMMQMMDRLPVVDADDERYTDPEINVQSNITSLQDHRKMAVGQNQVEETYAPEVQQALDAYDRGANTLDKLAVALGKSSWQTRPIYAQVREIRGVK